MRYQFAGASLLAVKMQFIQAWKEGKDPDIREYLSFYPHHAAEMLAFALEFTALESAGTGTTPASGSPAAPEYPAPAKGRETSPAAVRARSLFPLVR